MLNWKWNGWKNRHYEKLYWFIFRTKWLSSRIIHVICFLGNLFHPKIKGKVLWEGRVACSLYFFSKENKVCDCRSEFAHMSTLVTCYLLHNQTYSFFLISYSLKPYGNNIVRWYFLPFSFFPSATLSIHLDESSKLTLNSLLSTSFSQTYVFFCYRIEVGVSTSLTLRLYFSINSSTLNWGQIIPPLFSSPVPLVMWDRPGFSGISMK